MLYINQQNPSPRSIQRVVDILRNGGVIAYPTDTVYGIGCDIFNKKAIERIYQLKRKDKKSPLSFVCSDLSHISEFAKISNYAYRIMKRHLPGPYTFILNASSSVPKVLMPRKKTVGIRIPDNNITLSIVKTLGNPVISTSANISGQETGSDPYDIESQLKHSLDEIVDGGILAGDPSTVIDLTGDMPVVLREGAGDCSWI